MVHGKYSSIIMSEEEYHIIFPKTQVNFTREDLIFIINHIKSRYTSTLYFKLHCYDKRNNEIYTYTSPRWLINETYSRRQRAFSLSSDVYDKILYTQIELITIGISSENPLYFTECMFSEYDGDNMEYHVPNDVMKEVEIGLINSRYVNLYDGDGNFLQVIRPTAEDITNTTLLKSTCTVLAPHLYEESDIDDPVEVFMEYINQTEQIIDVLR